MFLQVGIDLTFHSFNNSLTDSESWPKSPYLYTTSARSYLSSIQGFFSNTNILKSFYSESTPTVIRIISDPKDTCYDVKLPINPVTDMLKLLATISYAVAGSQKADCFSRDK